MIYKSFAQIHSMLNECYSATKAFLATTPLLVSAHNPFVMIEWSTLYFGHKVNHARTSLIRDSYVLNTALLA